MWKVVKAWLAVAMVATFVVGCGGGGDTPTGDVTVSLSYNPPPAKVGVFYKYSPNFSTNQSISANFSIISGQLPPGLGISAGDGVISGTPTTTGTYTFTVRLTAKNVSGNVDRAGTITVNP